MADTPSTGNATPAVDQAAPTDTAQSTEETVQLAQAVVVVEVSPPARGADVSLTVEPGQTIELKAPVIRFTQDGGDLVIHWSNLGETHTTLVDALAAGTPLILADGTPLSFEQVIAQIEGFDPGAIAPAAGPPAPATAGGAFNTPFDNGTLGPEADVTALLLNTELQFGLIEGLEELPPVDENAPPLADDVLTPADRGELPGDLLSALSQLFPSVTIDFDTLLASGTFFTNVAEPYTEDGFVFITSPLPPGDDSFNAFVTVEDGRADFTGSAALAVNFFGDTVTLTASGAGVFDLQSIDLAEIFGSTPSVTFTGEVFGGGTVTQTFTLDGLAGAETFIFSSGFDNVVSVSWDQGTFTSSHQFDNIVIAGGGSGGGFDTGTIAFFKELTVDGIIGDSDLILADFGGADAETSLADLVFTLTSDPNYGFLIKVTSGGDVSVLNVSETFTSTDTMWWVATEADVSEFEVLPDATFSYSVTDADGQSASATVVVAAGLTLTGSADGEILVGGTGPDDLFGGGGDDVLSGGAGADTFHYESIGDGDDVITDFFDGADTIDLDDLFDALNTDGTHDGDYDEGGTARTDALKFSEDGGGNLVLTIDDTNAGDFEHFSITFQGLNQTDDEAAVLAAIVTE